MTKEINVTNNTYARVDAFIRTFGQDEDEEIYALAPNFVGKKDSCKVYKLVLPH